MEGKYHMEVIMERFFQSVEQALQCKDWYGALSTSLTIPDMCGKLEFPDKWVGERYKEWFNAWLRDEYTHKVGAERKTVEFLTAEDCYGLRCSYLHEGGGELERKAKHSLERFHFITPPSWGSCHRNLANGTVLQLQVDMFCMELVGAGRRWTAWIHREKPEVIQRMQNLLIIHDSEKGVPGLVKIDRGD